MSENPNSPANAPLGTHTGLMSDPALIDRCREALRRRIDAGHLKMPILPKVAGEILALTSDPNADLADLSSLIHRDQALAGHVLRIANSAAYGSGVSIVSLQQAVTRLGMKLLGEVALAVSVGAGVFKAPGFEAEVKLLWRHALASGSYGKEVARIKRQNVEGQFLCGLMHTVGKPIALQAIGEWQQETAVELPPHVVRNLVAQFDTVIGATIAAQWQLPRQVQIGCAFYRVYSEAPSFRDETAMTYLADRLAGWVVGMEPDETELPTDPVFAALNLYPDDVQTLLDARESILSLVNAMDL